MLAVVSDVHLALDVPLLDLNAPAGVAELIETHFQLAAARGDKV